jgi:hypothetical protein
MRARTIRERTRMPDFASSGCSRFNPRAPNHHGQCMGDDEKLRFPRSVLRDRKEHIPRR